VIEAAAAGDAPAREEFAGRYLSVAKAWFASRWRGTPLAADIDDAVQEVFVDCFREGGALGRAERDRLGGFRAYLFGVLRNVALRVETRRARSRERPPDRPSAMNGVPDSEESLGTAFDRAWALSLLEEAAQRCGERSRSAGPEAERRQRILRMRFEEDLPVRGIAERLSMEAAHVHREYARAREEFLEALLDVVGFHHPGDPGEVRREASRLLGHFR
jgi:RNA polymerase sigma-70 factor (ECF subfamily)